MEALQYKRRLVRDNWQELSESQRSDLGTYQGRTRAEIDDYFERLRSEFARQKAADEKRLREELEGNDGDEEGARRGVQSSLEGTGP